MRHNSWFIFVLGLFASSLIGCDRGDVAPVDSGLDALVDASAADAAQLDGAIQDAAQLDGAAIDDAARDLAMPVDIDVDQGITVVEVRIEPNSVDIPLGDSARFSAIVDWSDGTSLARAEGVEWLSDDPAVAAFALDDLGQLRSVAVGQTRVRARLEGVTSRPASITVGDAVLREIEVEPSELSLAVGDSVQVQAVGIDSAGARALIEMPEWATEDSTIAEVVDGALYGRALGVTEVLTSLGGVRSAPVAVEVRAPEPRTLTIAANAARAPAGRALTLTARITLSDATHADVTPDAVWRVEPPELARVEAGRLIALGAGELRVRARWMAMESAWLPLIIEPPVVERIVVDPSEARWIAGDTQAFVAHAEYSDGSQVDVTRSALWVSEPGDRVAVANGLARGNVPGDGRLIAQFAQQWGGAQIIIDPPAVRALRVDPLAPIPAGLTAPLRVQGTLSDGQVIDVNDRVEWRVEDLTVARVEAGSVIAIAEGEASLVAVMGAVTSPPVMIRVIAPQLIGVTIEAPALQLVVGRDAELVARAVYSNDATRDVTLAAEWRTDAPAIATVESGRVRAVAAGVALVRAAFEDIASAPTTIEVLPAEVDTLTVRPADARVALGDSHSWVAEALFSDGRLVDVSADALWRASDPTIARFDAPAHALGVAEGTTDVEVRYANALAQAQLTVDAAELRSLLVDPIEPTAVGRGALLIARGAWSDGHASDETGAATWLVQDIAVAIVAAGQLTCLAEGRTQLRAQRGDLVSAPVEIQCTSAEVDAIAVRGAPAALPVGRVAELTAHATWSDGRETDVSADATWTSAPPAAVSVVDGVVTAIAEGEALIQAELGGQMSRVVPIAITPAVVDMIIVAPADAQLAAGDERDFRATARRSDGSEFDATDNVVWQVEMPNIAALIAPGRLRGLSAGETDVSARLDDVAGRARLVVTPAELRALTIEPAAPIVPRGEVIALSARGTWSDGRFEDETVAATWSSADPSIAAINAGEATGVAEGVVEITARVGEVTATRDLIVEPPPNVLPTPNAVCPQIGRIGQALDFDARGSLDPDGEVVAYRWDFGDDRPAIDAEESPQIAYAFEAAGEFDVRLTVEDDRGGQATTDCVVEIVDSPAPTARIAHPQDRSVTTQGALVGVVVEPEPADGRRVVQVEILLDNVVVAQLEEAPFTAQIEIDMQTPTDAELRLTARVVDDLGATGVSAPITLIVRNAPPEAAFIGRPSGPRQIAVDARASSDDSTPAEQLEVRWDFDGDGAYDTPFAAELEAIFDYPEDGPYTVRLQVRDNVGQTAEAQRVFDFGEARIVGGDIETDRWSGAILVVDDVRLLPGHTLTVEAGSVVQVMQRDRNADDVGDLRIDIEGALVVEGTAEAPVVFTADGDLPSAGAWSGLTLGGEGPHDMRHVTVQYADHGVLVNALAELTDVAAHDMRGDCLTITADDVVLRRVNVHHCERGLVALDADDLLAEALTSADNRAAGVFLDASRGADFTALTSARNGIGVELRDASITTLSGATIRDSVGTGVQATSTYVIFEDGVVSGSGAYGFDVVGVGARIQRNQIVDNAFEGISAGPGQSDAAVRAHYNNIVGNATAGARPHRHRQSNMTLVVWPWSTRRSQVYAAPEGDLISHVLVSYFSTTSGRCRVLDAAGREIAVWDSFGSADWLELSRPVAGVILEGTNTAGQMQLGIRAVVTRGAPEPTAYQVTAAGMARVAQYQRNYLGAYPDLSAQALITPTSERDLSGTRGEAFDETWNLRPYYGGEVLEAGTVWSGEIFMSGRVDVPRGADLRIEPGTTIRVAGLGPDTRLVGVGPIVFAGTAQDPIEVRRHSDALPTGDWGGIVLESGSVTHTFVDGAQTGITTEGAVPITDSTAHSCVDGISLGNLSIASRLHLEANTRNGLIVGFRGNVSDVTAVDNGVAGVRVEGQQAVLNNLVLRRNGLAGLHLVGAVNTVNDLTARNNAGSGVLVERFDNTIRFADISENAVGLSIGPAVSTFAISNCVIANNAGAGVRVQAMRAQINRCNLTGNAAAGGPGSVRPVTVVDDLPHAEVINGPRTSRGPRWFVPNGLTLFGVAARFRARSTGSGWIEDQDGERFWSFNRNASATGYPPAGTRWLQAWASNTQGTGNEVEIRQIQLLEGAQYDLQLVALWAQDVNARDNWWGVADAAQAFATARANAVDTTGARDAPWPLDEVGPRE